MVPQVALHGEGRPVDDLHAEGGAEERHLPAQVRQRQALGVEHLHAVPAERGDVLDPEQDATVGPVPDHEAAAAHEHPAETAAHGLDDGDHLPVRPQDLHVVGHQGADLLEGEAVHGGEESGVEGVHAASVPYAAPRTQGPCSGVTGQCPGGIVQF